jgi:Na+-translocating ferredoxin:NAD+ oxidoreductase RnfG subunit
LLSLLHVVMVAPVASTTVVQTGVVLVVLPVVSSAQLAWTPAPVRTTISAAVTAARTEVRAAVVEKYDIGSCLSLVCGVSF